MKIKSTHEELIELQDNYAAMGKHIECLELAITNAS